MHVNRYLAFTGFCTAVACLAVAATAQQTRDEMVRGDRQALLDDDSWYYDDLDAGWQAARESGKPLMVVLRCIP